MDSRGDLCVTALLKGRECYVFLYDLVRAGELMRTIQRYAVDSQLSFSWTDAGIVAKHIQAEAHTCRARGQIDAAWSQDADGEGSQEGP